MPTMPSTILMARTCRVGEFALSSLVTRVTADVAALEVAVAVATGAETVVAIEGQGAILRAPGPTTGW